MSKSMIGLGLLALAASPWLAQAQTAAVVPVDDTPAPAPDAPPGSDSAPAASTPAPADDASSVPDSSSSSVDSGGSSGEDSSSSGGSGERFRYFVALDRTEITLNLSDTNLKQSYGSDKLDGGFYRVRAGIHLIPAIAIEGQAGFLGDDAKSGNEFKVDHYYALYLVPTGTVLNLFEISARVGYVFLGAPHAGQSHNFDSVSYGVSAEFPIRKISEKLPDIRLTLGGSVFTQENKERSYGFNYGLRYDFGL